MNPGFPPFPFFFFILLSCFPGNVSAAAVTLDSIQLHKTHELFGKPNVYFQCKGENKTFLPDLKETNVLYTFKGEESWQPLTEFPSKKCKRCGLYEKDLLTHDVFDEWEFCPSDFTHPDAVYTHIKDKEFNATFSCSACVELVTGPHVPPPPETKRKGINVGIVILISAAVTVFVIMGSIGVYRYWQKRKRQQEQARFLKLFEEHDFDDELGLGDDL